MAWLVIGLDQVMTIIPTEHAVNTVSNFLTSSSLGKIKFPWDFDVQHYKYLWILKIPRYSRIRSLVLCRKHVKLLLRHLGVHPAGTAVVKLDSSVEADRNGVLGPRFLPRIAEFQPIVWFLELNTITSPMYQRNRQHINQRSQLASNGISTGCGSRASAFKNAVHSGLKTDYLCKVYRNSCIWLHRNALQFLANVNSCSCSLYVVVRPSVVCLLSVCL